MSNKSKERVKFWENTVHGQRRKRLLARDERLAEEEARRVEMDQEYEEQVQNQRNTSINRAKMLMYNELDHVKQFRSRLLTQHILKVSKNVLSIKFVFIGNIRNAICNWNIKRIKVMLSRTAICYQWRIFLVQTIQVSKMNVAIKSIA